MLLVFVLELQGVVEASKTDWERKLVRFGSLMFPELVLGAKKIPCFTPQELDQMLGLCSFLYQIKNEKETTKTSSVASVFFILNEYLYIPTYIYIYPKKISHTTKTSFPTHLRLKHGLLNIVAMLFVVSTAFFPNLAADPRR